MQPWAYCTSLLLDKTQSYRHHSVFLSLKKERNTLMRLCTQVDKENKYLWSRQQAQSKQRSHISCVLYPHMGGDTIVQLNTVNVCSAKQRDTGGSEWRWEKRITTVTWCHRMVKGIYSIWKLNFKCKMTTCESATLTKCIIRPVTQNLQLLHQFAAA